MIEIDGVRRALESPITEAGDYISDEYLLLIDISTSPRQTTSDVERIRSSVRRLNRNLATTSFYLVGTEFAQPYEDVAGQLNQINQDVPDVDSLRPLIYDETRFQKWSGSFQRA